MHLGSTKTVSKIQKLKKTAQMGRFLTFDMFCNDFYNSSFIWNIVLKKMYNKTVCNKGTFAKKKNFVDPLF